MKVRGEPLDSKILKYNSKYAEPKSSMFQMLEKDGKIIYVNENWLKETGYREDEVIGKYFRDFLPEESIEHVKKGFPRLRDYGCIENLPLKLKKKDGIVIEAVLNGISVYDENGEFLNTRCELKTINYFIKYNQYMQTLLEEEIFLKKSLYMKSQINNALLFSESLSEFLKHVLFVLSEPSEVFSTTVVKFVKDNEVFSESSDPVENPIELEIKRSLIRNDFSEKISDDFMIIEKDKAIEGFENVQNFLDNNDILVISTIVLENKIHMEKTIFLFHLHGEKLSVFKEKWLKLLRNVKDLLSLGLNTFDVYENSQAIAEKLSEFSVLESRHSLNQKDELKNSVYREIERYKRYSTPFSLLIFKISNLDSIKNSVAELWVEEISSNISRVINTSIREIDQLFNLGNEKFIVILTETVENEAIKISERIKKKILNLESGPVNFTINSGVSESQKDDTFSNIYKRLDQSLRDSKKKSKDSLFLC
ncbi:diguanylate cyclase domain-containing protein [uncultured Ilyobacter sp.]|uniref:diguanylate cyclase domain-containing protein n=1 Tax=uncultured Ilyobacter sp. TaxID=544433 RepID=UPI0029F5554E|nr:diguanylate cyclase [uncultured Ilyobacter sp.]